MTLEFHPLFDCDVKGVVDYFRNQICKPELIDPFTRDIEGTLNRVERNPEAFGIITENKRHVRLTKFSYVIHYRVNPDSILIIGLYHTARNPELWDDRP